MKILIVDDLASVRKILRRLLSGLGYTDIAEAADGEEAFAKVLGGGFELIISDWEMPKLKGIELLKKVRSDEALKNTPFIMITSNGNRDAVLEAAEHKVSDYITKPFDQTVLSQKIEKAVSSHK